MVTRRLVDFSDLDKLRSNFEKQIPDIFDAMESLYCDKSELYRMWASNPPEREISSGKPGVGVRTYCGCDRINCDFNVATHGHWCIDCLDRYFIFNLILFCLLNLL